MRGTVSGIKPENSFSALSPLSPTVGCFAPHSHPSPPEEKAASRKKSRLRRKKTAPMACRTVSCVATPVGGGHGCGGAAAVKGCAPTFNSLSDSGVRRAIEATEGIALRGWRRRRQGHASHTMPYCLRQACFFSAEPTFFSRSDFFSATVWEVSGELRESPWA